MPKKSKKDVKESGAIAAAVSRHAAGQFSNSGLSVPRGFSSDSSSSSVQSPEMKPVATPSSNGNPTSPILDAITSASFGTNITAPSVANEWMASRGTPGMAGSPGNPISLMGESPPTQPSSYEDPRSMPYGWASPRPYMNSQRPSPSPPSSVGRRPLSYHMDAQYQSSDPHAKPASAAVRRSSLHSHYAQSRGSPNPPLPHEPQPHFYGVPDLGFDILPQGLKAGDRGFHFAFDKIPSAGLDRTPGKDNVVVAGYEGGLEVFSVGKRGLEPLVGLNGLRGGVHHAAILPWTSYGDNRDVFPLVAVVVHGPVLQPPAPDASPETTDEATSDERHQPTAKGGSATVEFYQTSVEVYSLRSSRWVATLLEAPKVPVSTPITSATFRPPPPSGAFQIKADGGTIVVSSGVTGECWVYRQTFAGPQEGGIAFKCAGKLWTALQQPVKGDTQQEAERNRVSTLRPNARSPIISLRGRWIAYCPAAPSSHISLRAAVTVPLHGKAPGVATVTPPPLPSVSSEIDLPISDSLVNKIMRDATQEFIQGAKWVGQQGWQAFNSYWNGPTNSRVAARSPPLGSQPWVSGGYGNRQEASQFPPTHGAMTPVVSKEPGIVSIVDAGTLGLSTALHPIASFSPPFGCSFLSFNPSGLALFTASSKGDVQTVWDLMRIQYAKSSPLQASAVVAVQNGSRVRQVAQFSRLTVARIVDVSWTKPHGERAAMITERGTVHLLDMPSSAFTWPPPRRRVPPQDPAVSPSEAKHPAVSMASSAFTTALGVARPLMARPRRSSSNVPQLTSSSIVDHASHGGKAIVATISHSLGKTGSAINQLRHTGENRASLPLTILPPAGACAAWIAGRRNHQLHVLGDGLVRAFPNRTRKKPSASDRSRTPWLTRYRDYKVPGLPEDTIADAVKRFLDLDGYLNLTERTMDTNNNTMILDTRRRAPQHDASAESAIPQAEIESSAPYQPFHTDRRVALYNYSELKGTHESTEDRLSAFLANAILEETPAAPSSSRKKHRHPRAKTGKTRATSDGGWVFGQVLDTVRLETGHLQVSDGESFNTSSNGTRALPPSAIERVLQHVGENDEQIVITTRRRRGGGNRAADDDDDGFFEDDCEVLDFADQRV
ncbi:hypothetical protein RB597_004882 [Gaeumannomyces tritici]